MAAMNNSGCLNGGGQIKPERREDMLHIAKDLMVLSIARSDV